MLYYNTKKTKLQFYLFVLSRLVYNMRDIRDFRHSVIL